MKKDVRRYRLFGAPQDVRRYYETGGVRLDAVVYTNEDGYDAEAVLPFSGGGKFVAVGRLGPRAADRMVACHRAGGSCRVALLETSPNTEGPVWADVELVLETPGEGAGDDETDVCDWPGVLPAVGVLSTLGALLFVGYAVWGVVERWLRRG